MKVKMNLDVVECLPLIHGMLGSVSSTKTARCGERLGPL